ncbi:MAG: malonate decarboxylase holo-[acyl-carrier-protein] synthase [Victivallaceae bacterium]|nr:malonate decarboxylase holo-[acyl-carrier-protein] synthase [Victivallaceae bacterium]
MAEVFVDFSRHDLLRLRPGCDFTSATADRDEIADWLNSGYPVIVRRPTFNADGVHCGIPLPPARGKRRLPFTVGTAAVEEKMELPRLRACIGPVAGLERRKLEAIALLEPYVFGSLAWQQLTGLEYFGAGSDVDLLFRVSGRREFHRLIEKLKSLDTEGCDIEIMLWNGDALSWGEWRRGGNMILLKCRDRVGLAPYSDLAADVTPEIIAAEAVSALREELETYPKPGLVSYVDNGRHKDMTAVTFNASIDALADHFRKIARMVKKGVSMTALRKWGIDAEADMLKATEGVNTHRGAIFSIGLLVAAAGCRLAGEKGDLGEIVRCNWGDDIIKNRGEKFSHGSEVLQRYGVGGARIEAASGFSSVYRYGLPAFRSALTAGYDRNTARVQAFFCMLEHVVDSTILYRGGIESLDYACSAAAEFNRSGGVAAECWPKSALDVHKEFVRREISAGGVADLLAAVIFIHQMEELWRDWQ